MVDMSPDPNGKSTDVQSAEEQLAIANARIAELEAQVETLQAKLRTNDLTGLTNRYGFEEMKHRLHAFVTQNQFTGNGCFVNIDLDGFKGVNDRFGHDVGDDVLRHFAKRLAEKVREHEIHSPNRVPIMAEPIHPSGDEYGILIIEAVAKDVRSHEERRSDTRAKKTDRRGNPDRLKKEISMLMDEIIQEIAENPLVIEGEDGPIKITHGVSYGIGMFSSPDVESIRIAQKVADDLMFKAKSGQSAFMECYEMMNPRLQQFAKDLMGDRVKDLDFSETGYPPNDIGMSAYMMHPDFAEFIAALNNDALKWAFPELAPRRAQAGLQIDR